MNTLDKVKTLTINNCATCPALYQHSEFPESECNLAGRSWGMGYYKGGPAPDWCPLRKESILLQLKRLL